MTRIAIFASGAGSNAARIIDYFKGNEHMGVALVVTNNPAAGVLGIAAQNGIPAAIIEKEVFSRGDAYLPLLASHSIGFIVLAGFLWKVPPALIQAFPSSIVNIHPSLLPAYGGKGMYGMKVHQAVIASGDPKSGISIHFVDELYDNGDIIFQESCDIKPADSPESLAQKIHQLEYAHFPRIIEQVITLQNQR